MNTTETSGPKTPAAQHVFNVIYLLLDSRAVKCRSKRGIIGPLQQRKQLFFFFPPHMGLDCDCVGAGALKNVLQQLLNDVPQFISNTSLTIKQQIKALASMFPRVTSYDKNFVTLRHRNQELIKPINQLQHFLVVSSSGQTC